MMTENAEHLYVHVPFCRTICYYCDFCHVVYREEQAEEWLQALQRETELLSGDKAMRTVYIGGGTPNSLSDDQFARFFSLFQGLCAEDGEFTAEVNPELLTAFQADVMKASGVNRISMGFQSADDRELRMMNRHHTAEDVRDAVHILRERGLDNISLDLMYSLPGQTPASLRKSMETAVSLQPDHLSLYSLTIEENSVFGKKGYRSCDEDTEADMYEMICTELPKYGYIQYEVSNFARNGRESMHNKAYWEYKDFHGLSAGASGKIGNIRYDKPKNIRAYIEDPFAREEILLSREDMMFEHLMMSLRMKRGLDLQAFAKRYGTPVTIVWPDTLSACISEGLLEINNGYLRLTDSGYPLMNEVLIRFLP